ncbi:hypothetical protein MKW98_003805 [Papaver atlanticum]|uniref:Phytocyanin domain-containing protein n=1 Tax=Papaver atlanticum TaxID=357466 RepID=A0AAD4XS08_9MAGN|nr:hypothetical protein MKW98_003805 [Papaver atlanticum]
MGVVERIMFFMAVAVLCVASSTAEVYKVGDDKGWTTLSPIPDYKKWSSTKAFKVGDSIVFEYNPQMHNVVQVNYTDYKKCNTAAAIRTLTSGNDTIPIKSKGHYFYICGIPGHCAMGQKVDIRVVTHVTQTPPTAQAPASPSVPTPSSGPSPSADSAPAPSPKKSSAGTISKGLIGKFGFVVLAVVAAVAF